MIWNEDLERLFDQIRPLDQKYARDDLLGAVRDVLASKDRPAREPELVRHYCAFPPVSKKSVVGGCSRNADSLVCTQDSGSWEYGDKQIALLELSLLIRANVDHPDIWVALDYAQEHTRSPEWLHPVVFDPVFFCMVPKAYSTRSWLRLNPALSLIRHMHLARPDNEGPILSYRQQSDFEIYHTALNAYLRSKWVSFVERMGLHGSDSQEVTSLLQRMARSWHWLALETIYLDAGIDGSAISVFRKDASRNNYAKSKARLLECQLVIG